MKTIFQFLATAALLVAINGTAAFADKQPPTSSSPQSTVSRNWTNKDGWNGLIPGKTKLADATKVLGKSTYNKAEDRYYFWQNEVNLSVDAKTKIIDSITVYPSANDAASKDTRLPHTIVEAEKIFGTLPMTQVGKGGTRLWEKPGLEVRGNEQRISAYTLYAAKWAHQFNIGQEHPSPKSW